MCYRGWYDPESVARAAVGVAGERLHSPSGFGASNFEHKNGRPGMLKESVLSTKMGPAAEWRLAEDHKVPAGETFGHWH